MKCFICKKDINKEQPKGREFHFHDECIAFKSKLTRHEKRKILRDANNNK